MFTPSADSVGEGVPEAVERDDARGVVRGATQEDRTVIPHQRLAGVRPNVHVLKDW